MKRGRIFHQSIVPGTNNTEGKYYVEYTHTRLGPYSHIFHRENLYYHRETEERGSYFFPLNGSIFGNTEIFLETNDIIIGVGSRGSFSGQEKHFVEIVNLKTKNKYRFYPEEVSLIYNSQDSIILYYKKSQKYHKLALDTKNLSKKMESLVQVSAFFKLLYNHSEHEYYNLYYTANTRSHRAGYFEEQKITIDGYSSINTEDVASHEPQSFDRDTFNLITQTGTIDVWESSLNSKIP